MDGWLVEQIHLHPVGIRVEKTARAKFNIPGELHYPLIHFRKLLFSVRDARQTQTSGISTAASSESGLHVAGNDRHGRQTRLRGANVYL